MLAMVGESGCGKSVTAMAMLAPAAAARRSCRGRGAASTARDLLAPDEASLRDVRGREISFVFQEPMTSLNPVVHRRPPDRRGAAPPPATCRARARAHRAVELLELVGIPAPARRVDEYPHQLSGGMRQRVMIAIAIACDPKVLIADEPTTALDVTIQARILDLMRDLRERLGTAIAAHHPRPRRGRRRRRPGRGDVRRPRRSSTAAADELFASPRHPYTLGLLARAAAPVAPRTASRLQEIPGVVPLAAQRPDACAFAPRCPPRGRRLPASAPPLAAVRRAPPRGVLPRPEDGGRSGRPLMSDRCSRSRACVKHFPATVAGGRVRPRRRRVSLAHRRPARSSGLVGESGSGKSTVGKLRPAAARARPPATIRAPRAPTSRTLSRRALRPLRRELHMVFQDPYSSLNPRMYDRRHRRRAAAAAPRGAADASSTRAGRRAVRAGRPARASCATATRTSSPAASASASASPARWSLKPSAARRRRAGVRARRLGPGLDPQPAARPAARTWASRACSSRTTSSIVEYLVRPRRGDVPRARSSRRARARSCSSSPQHPYTQALLSAALVPDPCVQRARRRIVLDGDMPSPRTRRRAAASARAARCRRTSAPRCVEERPALRRRRTTSSRAISLTPDGVARLSREGPHVHHPPGAARRRSAWSPRRTGSPRARAWRCSSAAATRSTPRSPPGSCCRSSSRTSTGPGGDVPAIVYSAERDEVVVVCGQGPAPAAATRRALRRARARPDPGHRPARRGRAGRVRRLDADAARLRHLGARGRDGARDRLRARRLPARARHPRGDRRASRTLLREEWTSSAEVYLPAAARRASGSATWRWPTPTGGSCTRARARRARARARIDAARDAFYRGWVAEAIDGWVARHRGDGRERRAATAGC